MREQPGIFDRLRAPTVDVGYVPNAKYLTHIPHQTGKSTPHEILQML